MKQELTFIVAIITVFVIGIFFGTKLEENYSHNSQIPGHPVFIWNDDLESIPTDNSPILLEHTINDTIFIGPLETEIDAAEYQFTVTDDSISVTDFDRYVGTVKIEGQLKQLIDKDNE